MTAGAAFFDSLVERLAQAEAAPRPWQKISDPAKALPLLRGEARRRLERLDPVARGLLVSSAEAEAARFRGKEQDEG